MIGSARRTLRKLRVVDLAVKISRPKGKGLRKRSKPYQRLADDPAQPLKPPSHFASIPAVRNDLHDSSLQESNQGNMDDLLDYSPSDLHLTIERLVAVRGNDAMDLTRKRRRVIMEERCPSLVGCNWEVFPPKQAIKRKVKLKIDSDSGSVEEGVGQCKEVEQPGSRYVRYSGQILGKVNNLYLVTEGT